MLVVQATRVVYGCQQKDERFVLMANTIPLFFPFGVLPPVRIDNLSPFRQTLLLTWLAKQNLYPVRAGARHAKHIDGNSMR